MYNGEAKRWVGIYRRLGWGEEGGMLLQPGLKELGGGVQN